MATKDPTLSGATLLFRKTMLQLNPNVQFYAYDLAKELYSCELQGSGDTFRCVLPQRFVQVLRSFDGKKTPEEAIISSAGNTRPEEHSKILHLVQSYFVRNQILIDPESVAPAPVDSRRRHASPTSRLYLRIPILRGALVKSVVVALSPLFSRSAVLLSLICVAAAHIHFYTHAVHLHTQLDALVGTDFLIVVVATLLSALFHELGHVTALIRNGGNTVEIGFGIYIMFPVFYANVSECWRFPRSERLQVNVGGLYFQSLTLLPLAILNAWRPSLGLAFSFLWIDLLLIRNLNPFLRMDGYWILADLLGEPSLHRSAAVELKRICTSLLTRQGRATLSTTRMRPALILYCLVTAVVFAAVYYRFTTLILLGLLPKFPAQIHALSVAAGNLQLFKSLSVLFSLAWQLMMIYVFLDTLVGFCRQYLPRLKERVTMRRAGGRRRWLQDASEDPISPKIKMGL